MSGSGERDNLVPAIFLAIPAYEATIAGMGVASAHVIHKLIKEKSQLEGIGFDESAKRLGVVFGEGEKNESISKGDLRKVDKDYLKKKGYDGHTLKGGGQGKSKDAKSGAGSRNIYQDKNGNLYEWDEKGEPEPLGENIKK